MALFEQSASRQRDERRWSSLMVRSHAGDSVAYNRLLSELGEVIQAYLLVNFGALNSLEECVQESLLAVHNARHTYDSERAFRPWFFTIVRHKTIDILRHSDSFHKVESEFANYDQVDIDDIDLSRVIDGEKLMAKLTDEQRQAVALTKYLGMTTVEASDLLGVTEGTVKARLRRGIQAIKKQWQEALV